MRTEKAVLKDGRTLDFIVVPDPPAGTMKEVYFTPDRSNVVCFYKDPSAGRDPVRMQRLESICTKFNPTVPKSQGGAAQSDVDAAYYRRLFCWPTGIVLKPYFGLVTPAYPKSFFFAEGPWKGGEKNGKWFTSPKLRKYLETSAPRELGTWISYLTICIQMTRAVARLHQAGLAHSDLSNNNVLVDPAGGASVVIDIDSLVVPGLYPPDVLGTKGYIAPEVLSTIHLDLKDSQRKHPNARTDEHALAVLIYENLLKRHPLDGQRIPPGNTAEEQDFLQYGPQAIYSEHPQNNTNRPEQNPYVPATSLGAHLNDLFSRAFVEGIKEPNRRPTAGEWLKGLLKTADMVLPCANASCAHKFYVLADPKIIRCPFCGQKPAQPVPLLKLRSEGRAGNWFPDGVLAGYHGLRLYKHHVFDNLLPGPGADMIPQAHCLWHNGQWLLVNEQLASLTSPGGNRVAIGQAVALAHGARIRLAQESHGRIIEVDLLQP